MATQVCKTNHKNHCWSLFYYPNSGIGQQKYTFLIRIPFNNTWDLNSIQQICKLHIPIQHVYIL